MTTNVIAITAFTPDVKKESSAPYPIIEIGAVNMINIPPPIIIKIHITKINKKM